MLPLLIGRFLLNSEDCNKDIAVATFDMHDCKTDAKTKAMTCEFFLPLLLTLVHSLIDRTRPQFSRMCDIIVFLRYCVNVVTSIFSLQVAKMKKDDAAETKANDDR